MKHATKGLMFFACLGATAAGFATDTPNPPEIEQPYLQRNYEIVDSAEIRAYLELVADKLLATRPKAVERPPILLYSSSGFVARATSAKVIELSTETLQQLESEDELAALLAHELTHIVMGHPVKKSLLAKFPVSVETMGEIAATKEQVKADAKLMAASASGAPTAAAAAQAAKPQTEFAKDTVKTSQNVSLFWSDLLMPHWNKNDEREADRVGYDMMRAAGYDPEAFATLFQKLQDAQLKRSARMEQLRLSMKKRAQERALQQPANMSGEFAAQMKAAGEDLRKMASEKAIDALFEGLAKMGKDYDSPEMRQDLLKQHAAKLPPMGDDKIRRSPLFAQNLREGAGGALLAADRAAIAVIASLEASDLKAAEQAMNVLAPPPAPPPPAKPAKKAAPAAKPAKAAKNAAPAEPQIKHPVPLASPHLNQAVGRWWLAKGKGDAAELYAQQWMSWQHAPAKAFEWRAAFQADRAEFVAATLTLEEGGRRLDSEVPFLPERVAYARFGNDIARAQELTRACRAEEHKRKSIMRRFLDVFRDSPPTGLYAECLAKLGSPLPDEPGGLRNILTAPLRSEALTGNSN